MEQQLYEALKQVADASDLTQLISMRLECQKICEAYEALNASQVYEEFAPEGVLTPKENPQD